MPVSLHASGRTDAGVHAEGQAIRFHAATALPADALRHRAARTLPPGLLVTLLEEAPPGWNPQRDALGKHYRYDLLESVGPAPARERAAWRVGAPGTLDVDAMRSAARSLVGRHDFRAFRNDPGPERRDENTVRTVESIDVTRALDLVRVDVRGGGFLYMMVRNVVASLAAVGWGAWPVEWVAAQLASRDRASGPPPAPPHGLALVSVRYPDGFGA